MAIDLLKLDRDCAMPTILRRKWKEMHGYDPVRAARRHSNIPVWFGLLLMTVCVLYCISKYFFVFTQGGSAVLFSGAEAALMILGAGIGVIFFGLGLNEVDKRAGAFANALENLPLLLSEGWSCSVEILCNFDEPTLKKRAEKEMVRKVHTLLAAEHAAKENTHWTRQEKLDGIVTCQRQKLKDTHAALLAFQLVDEKWDRYFAEAQAELPKKEPENLPSSSVAPNEIAVSSIASG